MFSKLLIANRGEIACRVIKTANRLGIQTVAVYSDADVDALHVNLADEAIYIGAAPAKDSYLQGQKIIDAALKTGAQAIHPGYGFLSENAEFAKRCADNGITFVGPPVSAIEAMGSKSAAKQIMQSAGVPLVPGYHGDEQSPELLKSHADKMGYPVLLKAAAGGGGKGMRQVWQAGEFNDALAAAKREALSSFADDKMLVEKYLTEPRHVEIQVFCDNHSNGVYLFERDCSVQRRHQKIIEEAPAPGLTQALREQMGQAAIKAAQAIDYRGAGTVEFLLDKDGSFYFMEMNTRLQVEHPVTEMITKQDLVEWQLKVANDETLPLAQQALQIHGHAFEARVYAEDPNNDFLPATGNLALLKPPIESDYVRVDTGVQQGDEISIYYDPMIAKLIVWDENRECALARLSNALADYHIDGLTTNIGFLYDLASSTPFKQAELSTHFIEQHANELFAEKQQDVAAFLPHAALSILLRQNADKANSAEPDSPWSSLSYWRANHNYQQQLDIKVGDQSHQLIVEPDKSHQGYWVQIGSSRHHCQGYLHDAQLHANIDGHQCQFTLHQCGDHYSLFTGQFALQFEHQRPDLGLLDQQGDNGGMTAPMNGRVVSLLASVGEAVEKDQPLLVMEAMKMEHTIRAPNKGKVVEFFYQAGDLVDGGQALLNFEAIT